MAPHSQITPRLLRTALKAYNKPHILNQNPLVQLALVEKRIQKGHSADLRTLSKSLRELLLEAIEALKPDAPFVATSNAWRGYTILREQYLGNKSANAVAAQLHLEHTAYHKEQAQVLERLALLLSEWEHKTQSSATQKPKSDEPPFMAPLSPTHKIVGREALLSSLKQQLMSAETTGVSAIHGLPGVGKTALAIEIANDPDIIAHFTGGILWVGLGRQPDVLALLGSLAKALGFGDDILATLKTIEARAQFVHNAIGLQKMLLVVDDAWASDVALTFRVGGPNCAHLLTTRFPNIAFDFGVNQTTAVTELSDEASLQLFAGLAPKAAGLQPQQMSDLVRNVGRLPLAITLMGKYLGQHSAGNSERRLAQAIQRLSKAQARFNLSQPRSPLEHQHDLATTQASLENVIGTSYSFLDAEQQRALQVLSLFSPKPNTFSEEAAVAVSDAAVETLDALVDAGLVEGVGGRYTLHQTIADFAHEKSTGSRIQGTYKRFVEYHVLFLKQNEYEYEQIDNEIINIKAALNMALVHGYLSSYASGATKFCHYLMARGQAAEVCSFLNRVVNDMKKESHAEDIASAYDYLGRAAWNLGHPDQAKDSLKRGLSLAQENGLEEIASQCLSNLGNYARLGGDLTSAKKYLDESLVVARRCNSRRQQCLSLRNLGAIEGGRLQFDLAIEYLEMSLSIAESLSLPDYVVGTLSYLGVTLSNMGNLEKAITYFDRGIDQARKFNFRVHLCDLLTYKSDSLLSQSRLEDAVRCLTESLGIARIINRKLMIGFGLSKMGDIAILRSDYRSAIQHFEEAISIASAMEDELSIVAYLSSLGECNLKCNDLNQANSLFEKGINLARKCENSLFTATYLYDLGLVAEARGDQTKAKSLGEESLAIIQKLDFHPRRQEIEDWVSKL